MLPARNQRELPWQSTLQRSTVEGEQVRPIFWSYRQASYIARTAAWDEFPNGRWGDRTSPAYGELSEYYLALKRPKLQRTDLWGTTQTEQDVWNVFVRFIDGHVKQLPCQPRVNGAPSSDPSVGWGGDDGVVFQKAYVEFFVAPEKMAHLVKVMRRDYPQLSFHALNRKGDEHRNTPLHTVSRPSRGESSPVLKSCSRQSWARTRLLPGRARRSSCGRRSGRRPTLRTHARTVKKKR
ncbi:hypothetical protein PF010_g16545 [Phytophthora fragariae]|uniref:MTHFR SAM-binding regulatory domain-containing protein n=1 Tax=Phytophthora fragariae TaxID=53985 RepID=A0A6A4DDC1_9STRA|nr:hypothetical protein PF010_g16545 [Phytophthora fragariae]KAE9222355.1 hypothetical protein PF002_g15297 [Phytophthora fragariae]KAE9300541.1 hypothetical protein PF001_g14891 [Phytophthora fragariae]